MSKQKYIDDYQRYQGILLEAGKVKVNPARGQVAKLCLNSLWGKFVQETDIIQTSIVKDPKQFFSLAFSGKSKLQHVSFLHDGIALVQWSYRERCVVSPGRSNNVHHSSRASQTVRVS